MGWGAAQAFYEENSSWLDSPEDAYEALYGNEPSNSSKRKCPLCGKKFGGPNAVRNHLSSEFHKPDKAEIALKAWNERFESEGEI